MLIGKRLDANDDRSSSRTAARVALCAGVECVGYTQTATVLLVPGVEQDNAQYLL